MSALVAAPIIFTIILAAAILWAAFAHALVDGWFDHDEDEDIGNWRTGWTQVVYEWAVRRSARKAEIREARRSGVKS